MAATGEPFLVCFSGNFGYFLGIFWRYFGSFLLIFGSFSAVLGHFGVGLRVGEFGMGEWGTKRCFKTCVLQVKRNKESKRNKEQIVSYYQLQTFY